MKKTAWVVLALVIALPASAVLAGRLHPPQQDLDDLNLLLRGKIIDYTANHGKDKRIWSRALNEGRDLYVYLPPRFDPKKEYPLVLLLHGFGMDERMLLKIAPRLDWAISDGEMPPVIVAAPDGSLANESHPLAMGSFFLNTPAGAFEDFVIQDVWDFMVRHYPIRREREAHVLAGACMGGFAAYSLGIRHRNGFGVVVGVMPPLNLRWQDKENHYQANFDPYDWGWRKELNPREIVGRLGGGRGFLRVKDLLDPIFSEEAEAMETLVQYNPIELVDRTHLRNGELAMYVGYGGKDEYNVDAQVESFLYLARFRKLGIAVGYDPEGRHDVATAVKLFPDMIKWLAPQLARYSPSVNGKPKTAARTEIRIH